MPQISTLEGQIACVERELGKRRGVYPNLVAAGKMKQEKADNEIFHMESALFTLQERLREKRRADGKG